ncbi:MULTISPECIES: LacI family DNA-binding transcriptional regulator [Alphaproteobacteria]|uniref:LacI family DNA-binding transcriptional regulator n=1 Tax=Alphaproteobacteria TaxID=28211 RepID=UPI003A952067
MKKKPVTAEDVALYTGVSRSTVSRVFSNDKLVKKSTQTKVLKAAEKLGYQPNAFAKALISQRSPIVGIIINELTNPFQAVLHVALTNRLQAAGYLPMTAQLGPDSSIEEAVSMFRQYQVGAVLLTSMVIDQKLINACREAGLLVGLLNRVDEAGVTASVCADMEQGGHLAAEHMISRGYSKIAIVEGHPESWTRKARLKGQISGLEDANMSPFSILEGNYTYESGTKAAHALLSKDERPDAVICANDLTAIGLMDTARLKYGVRIPEDLAVIGFDDIPMANWESFDLTTVRLPVNKMLDRMIDLIDRLLTEQTQASDKIWIPCRLVLRGTT